MRRRSATTPATPVSMCSRLTTTPRGRQRTNGVSRGRRRRATATRSRTRPRMRRRARSTGMSRRRGGRVPSGPASGRRSTSSSTIRSRRAAINLVQPINGARDRYITKVEVRFDGNDTVDAELDGSSRTPTGQTIDFGDAHVPHARDRGDRSERRQPPVARVLERRRLRGGPRPRRRDRRSRARVAKSIRMPNDLLDATGTSSLDHPLVVVMSRERVRADSAAATIPNRRSLRDVRAAHRACLRAHRHRTRDERGECRRARRAPARRRERSDGRARRCERVPGRLHRVPRRGRRSTATWRRRGRRRSTRCAGSTSTTTSPRRSRSTTWTSRSSRTAGTRCRRASGSRSTARCAISRCPGSRTSPARTRRRRSRSRSRRSRAATSASRSSTSAKRARSTSTRRVRACSRSGSPSSAFPVCAPAALDSTLAGVCRSDLLRIDDAPVPVRITGSTAAAVARQPLNIEACDPADPSTHAGDRPRRRGSHVVRGRARHRLGCAARPPRARVRRPVATPLAVADGRVTGLPATPPPTPTVEVTDDGRTRMRVHVDGRRRAVLARARSVRERGLAAPRPTARRSATARWSTGTPTAGSSTRREESFDVVLEWTPQERVWASLWVSLAGVIALPRDRRRHVVAAPARRARTQHRARSG